MEILKKYFNFIPWIIFLFLAVFLLSGCGAQWHLKQSKRHKILAISKGAEIELDTVYKIKNVITKEVRVDSVFKDVIGDTVYINRDNLKIKYVRMPGDTVFIEGKAERDTLRILVPTTVTEVIHQPEPTFKWWHWLLAGIAIGVIFFLLVRR